MTKSVLGRLGLIACPMEANRSRYHLVIAFNLTYAIFVVGKSMSGVFRGLFLGAKSAKQSMFHFSREVFRAEKNVVERGAPTRPGSRDTRKFQILYDIIIIGRYQIVKAERREPT